MNELTADINDCLRELKEEYERRVVVDPDAPTFVRSGDIGFLSGNGSNNQPYIVRVLEANWRPGKHKVANIYPGPCHACGPDKECEHGHIMPEGSFLLTEVAP